MNLRQKELIIFDFDGTLINSIPDLTLATNEMLSHYSLPPLTIEEVTPFIGNGAKLLVTRALEFSMSKKATPELLEEALDIYVDAYNKTVCQETYMYPNVHDTLKQLHNNGFKLVICTNKPYRFIEPILDKLAIKEYFTTWIGEDSIEKKKPDAAPLLHLAELNNTSIDKCVMVGDSRNDILAAQNAKMESIGVSYGYNYNENIKDYSPTIVIDDFKEILTLY